MLAGMIGAGVMVAVIVFFSYYKVDTVEVRGTSHYTDEEVKNMVLRGPMASNSVLHHCSTALQIQRTLHM